MGYYDHKYKLSLALDFLTEHGLPVDRAKQDKLRDYLNAEEVRISGEIQFLVPFEVRPILKKEGYKTLPKDLRTALKERELLVKGAKLDYYHVNFYELCNSLGYYYLDDKFVKVGEFNANSTQQLQLYIEHMGYEMPKHIETGKPTTGKEALEQLVAQHDDEVLKRAQRIKKISKLRGTYASGDWIPGADGRVHGKFKFGTASGQTSSTEPNIQQYPEHYDKEDEWLKEIMQMVKESIRAEEGFTLVKVDMRSFHGRMQGFLAEDPAYYKLADFDLHSYNTAHYVGLPDAHDLLSYDDQKLRSRLKEIKNEYEYERNAKLKRVAYLMQFGGGADKAFQILSAFSSVAEVIELMNMVKDLFPRTFKDFQRWVKRQLYVVPRIITPFGCLRYFWDGDLQQATAFPVSNCAHCHIQLALIRLFESGAFFKYGACNFTHDALWYHVRTELVQECVSVTRAEFERASDVLVNSLGAFFCHADAQAGPNMYDMEDV